MQISFVIPVINEVDNIRRSVESAVAAGASEVIVVDGGSIDGTLDAAAELPCTIVHSAAGRARQQNRGAEEASGDVLLFQHADNYFADNVVPQIETAFDGRDARFGAFQQQIDADGLKYRLLEWGNARRVQWLGSAYGDQGIFVCRKLFLEIGGFADVPLLEDVLLIRQLCKQGRPALLQGPLHVSARRWKKNGVVRQTLENWTILGLHKMGVSPQRLAARYQRHDGGDEQSETAATGEKG